MTTPALTSVQDSISTNAPLSESLKPDVCSCLHGGTCIDQENLICECPNGFQGTRCETTYIEFVSGNNPNSKLDSNVLAGIVVSSLVVLLLVVTMFLVWRRCTRIREKRRWVRWQESRSQSKATIEGFTIVEPLPMQSKQQAKFSLQIFKTINHKNILPFRRHANMDIEAVKMEGCERKDSAPSSTSTSADSQTQLMSSISERRTRQQSSRVSVISRGSDVTLVTNCGRTEPSDDACDADVERVSTSSAVNRNTSAVSLHMDDFKVEEDNHSSAPGKTARHSLPNALSSNYKPPHNFTRTRRLSFAPTLQEVIHI